MAAALLTATLVSIAGLALTIVLGVRVSPDHATVGVFVTMITLLAHSMMMFYLIGKGKAVREAAAEGGLPGTYFAEVARLRKPVFSSATLAMALTMAAAIIGASVDTGVMAPPVHGVLALVALASNCYTVRLEVLALAGSARIVSELNRLLGA